MQIKIMDAIENKAEILKFDNKVFCPICGERFFSPFDKLYIHSYGKCAGCSTDEEIEALSDNIFAIL